MEFYYDGICSREFGLKIKSKNDLDAPLKNVEEIKVPGRNGSLFIDDDDYENKVIDIICLVDFRKVDEKEVATKLKEWLLKDTRYKKLQFSDDSEFYYEAVCVNKIDFSEMLNNYYEILISFSCKPFKVREMDKVIIRDNGWKIYNDSALEAYPKMLIKLSKTASIPSTCNIYVNNQAIQLSLDKTKTYELDCELMNLTAISGEFIENANDRFISGDFPVLEAGDNSISWVGAVEEIVVYPNLKYL